MRNRGFTLLEVLVVLALLAVLLSLAAPSFIGLRQKHQMQSQGELAVGAFRSLAPPAARDLVCA